MLRYEPGQAYVPHSDYFALGTSQDHNWDARHGGANRFATVFLYLSDVAQGGETVRRRRRRRRRREGEEEPQARGSRPLWHDPLTRSLR